ncbi:hypothetical protein JIN84_04455 [Luteolibacter yonseiensis]|uniref:Uncharacterized protein n=1 Tax=Luteolibacter yonseiensis TaxID=1144680 RepID=A0A934V977_9BACT|nr:hypothetical protein [Luteolibacter yonseiensis]MBK1814853.1 hypothetical protein [Luteolibacter yonseiensis]
MHRLPSQHAVTRFKVASWLIVLLFLLLLATSGLLVHSLVTADRELASLALGLMGGTVAVGITQWAVAIRARCPLCHAKSIARNGCSKHRNARALLGSYRLRVALSIIFQNKFRCPYCGESTAAKARGR